MSLKVSAKKRSEFDPKAFLSTMDGGRKIATFSKKQTIFVQGDPCNAVFYIQKGKVRLTVVSKSGKVATTGILNEGDFFGEGVLSGQALRMFSATAMTDCCVMRIVKGFDDGSAAQGTRILRYVPEILTDTEHAIRRGLD